ncbi:pyruvate, phosphate dikinase [Candidatus Shapirobacteria bacterium CG_4_9_14_0_2_um_filter_40_11]|uniref:Pyruvate, phosphate dikinase n=1 Tax=Candidatus Shapirobacteria bacterium CG_4_9_14_0_2_um_filter_40_11 TaxID=1974876 RepID=A0A2M8EVK8_9BACT|nr:MAG: pyruvate, phosphate dikinase [Candidatus Shapirobacteria bacterium CG_4_9_14_0_2_um_filter_40_11]
MVNKAKYVYFFGEGKAEGNGKMKDILGGKGAGLAEMTNADIPVPPGFTITTDVCRWFYSHDQKLPNELDAQYQEAIAKLEKAVDKKFGNSDDPLLVSVRSGAKFSMPGMMDTVLNLGLNDEAVLGLAEKTNNERFAYDAYRRFIHMFSNVVLGIEKEKFEAVLIKKKESLGIKLDTELKAEALKELIVEYKELVKEKTKHEFPQEALVQLALARDAVFKSWNTPRAVTYRRLNKIADDLGTAVNIQAMVFGNMGDDCATGVGFTRNPSTGEKAFYGEYLTNAQGEDVVAGIRTPKPITELGKDMPLAYEQLREITTKLEQHYKDIQDFEFTIEKGKLYMLQTRNGKRTAFAAVKVAVDMFKEGLLTKDEALMRVEPNQINQLLHPIFDPKTKYEVLAKGLPASPGAAVGKVVFTSEEAVTQGDTDKVILVRLETCPDDIAGMDMAQGVLTARGGITSHAAVVARGMGKCAVVGCETIKVSEAEKKFTVDGITVTEGQWISINGNTGEVILDKVPTVEPELTGDFGEFMGWADEVRKLGVRANADIPRDAIVARKFGAEGIGLCRTEHMFFAEDRLPFIQEMIVADTEEGRRKALDKLLAFQKEDFKGLFKEMEGLPVTIRTLDPPLHEFLPKTHEEAVELSKKIGVPADKIWARAEELHELNPMLGHRGCRLGITYPEITEMQVKAIILAACELKKDEKIEVEPEIMIPLVGNVSELKDQKELVVKVAEEVMKQHGVKIHYKVGTMIEVPRGALTADEVAEEADFFSCGTNDLTQMTMGFSRDDSGKFIKVYLDKKIIKDDPFQTLDQTGVGQLVQMAVEKGRSVKKDLKVGICGEHGGDPESIKFCHRVGLNYVSCSPYRVPIARLAASQAVIEEKMGVSGHTNK